MDIIRIVRESTFKSGLVSARQLSRLVSSTRTFSANHFKTVQLSGEKLVSHTATSLNNNKNLLAVMDSKLNILNPENVLKRGYTITSLNGKIVKKSSRIKKDDIIDTMFSDGSVTSKVVEKKA